MASWPLKGGAVKDPPSDQNFRGLALRGGEVETDLRRIEKEGLPASGKAGGVLKGEYPNPEFAKEPAYKAELENETTARKEADTTLKGEGEAEKASREAAVKAEKEAREAADAAEKAARETADNERVKGPASSTESDIATYNGATGKVIKDSGKTIASVLVEAEETAKLLASAAAAGLSIKNPVAYASTAAITVSKATALTLEGTAPLEVDGAKAFAEGTRLLLKTQASESQNGIFEVTTDEAFAGTGKFGGSGKFAEGSKWLLTRTKDADETSEVKQGMYVPVTKGVTNAGTAWVLSTPDPIEIGTTAQAFGPYTAVPGGSAGGDLEGTYPNPQIKAKTIVNGDVSDTAGIEYKKLKLEEELLSSDLGAGIRDYGLVSALPTEPTPSAGDRCTFIAVKGEVLWGLIYDGEGEYPWKKIGGPPLFAEVATLEISSSAAYGDLATKGPSVTLPLKGDYDVEVSAFIYPQEKGVTDARMSYEIGGTAASDADSIHGVAAWGSSSSPHTRKRRKTKLAAVTLLAKYKKGVENAGFEDRWISADPVRVG